MAENKISFNRFTAFPNNIATYGSTPEELKLQAGTPDPNPSVSPMPSATPADVHLALGRLGSDKLRFQEPVTPAPNAFENNRLNLSVSRAATKRLKSPILRQMSDLIGSGQLGNEKMSMQMAHSLERVRKLSEFLDYQNKLTDAVYARTVSNARG